MCPQNFSKYCVPRIFVESGATKKTVPYLNGERQGSEIVYYESGVIREATPYVESLENGSRHGYYESGNPEFILSFSNGNLAGPYTYFWESNGVIQYLTNYSNNLENGERKFYLETGELFSCEVLTDGVVTGDCVPE